MKLKTFSSILAIAALGLVTTGAYAQAPAPTSPAPAPTELVYLPQLPSVATLMNTAKAQGVTVVRVDQTSSEINVVYRDANGLTNTVSYQVLPNGETPAPAGTPAPTAPGTTVVYQTTSPAYYASPYYYDGYYPWGWYAPIGVGIGFGFHGGYGGFRGGWRR